MLRWFAARRSSAPPSAPAPDTPGPHAPGPADLEPPALQPFTPEPFAFDALIALAPDMLPPGLSRADAVRAVRAAVQVMPGAGWVGVEYHGVPSGLGLRWVEVFPPDSGLPLKGERWDALRATVERAARAALAALSPNALPPAVPPPTASPLVRTPGPWPGAFEPASPLVAGFAEAPMPAFELPPGVSRGVSFASPPASAGPGAAARERLLDAGADALSDAELMEALLSHALPRDAAPDEVAALARAVTARFGSFASALAAGERELRAVPGLGTHCIAAIKLVHDAALRLAQAEVAAHPVLADPARLMSYLHAVLSRERIEQFRILFLDADGRLVADEAQARGTVNHTPVYPREVVKRALELGAAALVLVHNHPSGDPTPSREDLDMTGQVRQAADLLGVRVVDHVIVGNGRWTSFKQAGLL